MPHFVGRTGPLARLTAAHRAVADENRGPASRRAGLTLVTGEAGIGKTALLTRFATEVASRGGWPVWGTCWDGERAPAYWPWTQVFRALFAEQNGLRDAARPELAVVVPELASVAPGPVATADAGVADRLRVFDAAAQLLSRAAAEVPVVVILDDLQWSDRSTVDLLRFVASQPAPGGLLLVGSCRPKEADAGIAARLTELATTADLVVLQGLLWGEVAELVEMLAGASAVAELAQVVYERSGGHPFFARELCRFFTHGGERNAVPAAIRDVIGQRLARLSAGCVTVLNVAAVAGTQVSPDVLADASGADAAGVAELVAEAAVAGILAPTAGQASPIQFAHDLYRESIYSVLSLGQRLELHHRVADALVRRHERGSEVFPAELARQFTAAVPVAGAASALSWARGAADADAARFAFAEAAGHLTRVRSAIAAAGDRLPDRELIQVLTTEADLWLRAGDVDVARPLLDTAWARAVATGQPDLIGTVALGLDRVGARFAMPRTELVAVLDSARQALDGTATAIEAQVLAALARQLQHSVSGDRPRARPLAERAVAIARDLKNPGTLASCLLAQHDTLWTPGTATQRAAIAGEIADLARQATDPERHAQALLLSATAQLENGSPAFRATLAQFAHLTEQLRQARHNYLLRTRQAALALLDGDIDTGERLSIEAAALGEAVGDSDAGNVRMSQRLEICRARGDATELCSTAAEAVRWWVGAPAHAHAVAAGFYARGGDLDAAQRELETVLALDEVHTDRSYLWSVFVGELVVAAIALQDRPLCARLLDDLLPIANTCAVNGAFVCFMGAHAHRIGLLYAALSEPEPARQWLQKALNIHRRLGAQAWEAETRSALASLDGQDRQHATAQLRRVGDMWEASFHGRSAYLRDAKGLHDLAALLAQPGVDLPALDLAGGKVTEASAPEPVLDRAALAAYRRRLAELDDELGAAQTLSDLGRQRRAAEEREQLLAELRRATRPNGTVRNLGSTAAERARKAVTARIRDAIRRIADVLPDLGTHLDRTIRTGMTCRYDPGP